MDWDQIITWLFEFATTWGIKLLIAIILLIVGIKLIKALTKWISNSTKLNRLDSSLRTFLGSFTKIALYIVLFITVAMILGVPATSFITILASGGVAIGLAVQGSLSNFAGGIMILIFKPFKVGDYIEADGNQGTVHAISVVYTVLLSSDNKQITIPNGTLTNCVIKNYTAEKLRRVDFKFTASYNNDVEAVKKIIFKVIEATPKALKDPAPFVRLSEHSENALTYTVRVWCKTEDYWDVNFDITEKVKTAFDQNGIEIPYPQLDVHVTKQ